MGVCCAEFSTQPPQGAVFGINSRLSNVGDEPETEPFYECREHPTVQEACFLNSNNWMIPINISELSGLQCRNLPRGISVLGAVYRLGGFSVHSPGHYSGVISGMVESCTTMVLEQRKNKDYKVLKQKI